MACDDLTDRRGGIRRSSPPDGSQTPPQSRLGGKLCPLPPSAVGQTAPVGGRAGKTVRAQRGPLPSRWTHRQRLRTQHGSGDHHQGEPVQPASSRLPGRGLHSADQVATHHADGLARIRPTATPAAGRALRAAPRPLRAPAGHRGSAGVQEPERDTASSSVGPPGKPIRETPREELAPADAPARRSLLRAADRSARATLFAMFSRAPICRGSGRTSRNVPSRPSTGPHGRGKNPGIMRMQPGVAQCNRGLPKWAHEEPRTGPERPQAVDRATGGCTDPPREPFSRDCWDR